jgi:hypothetical protein
MLWIDGRQVWKVFSMFTYLVPTDRIHVWVTTSKLVGLRSSVPSPHCSKILKKISFAELRATEVNP